jgi:hypothetical protein
MMKEEKESLLGPGGGTGDGFSLDDSLSSSIMSPTLANIKLISRSASSATLTGGGGTNPLLSREVNNPHYSKTTPATAPHHHHHHHHHSKKDIDPLSHDFSKFFNMRNAKMVASVFVLVFIFYHGSLNSFYGRNSCNRLLGEGHLLGDNEWQPAGCMIHKYTKK